MITPTESQCIFIDENTPRLTWETYGYGSGGTTALVLAAMRDMRVESYRALLLKGHAPAYAVLQDEIRKLAPQCGSRQDTWHKWTFGANGGELHASAAYSITLTHERYDFIGIDDVEYLGLSKLEEIAKHLCPNGRLRCTLHTQRLNKLLGPRMVKGATIDPMPVLSAEHDAPWRQDDTPKQLDGIEYKKSR